MWLLCAFTLGVYALIGLNQRSEFGDAPAEGAYYNLLAAGFRAGQLHLPVEPPAGLLALRDPLDPAANAPFRGAIYTGSGRLHDLSLFEGRLHLYFGPSPALLLFGPFSWITGRFLSHAAAAVLLAATAFLAATALLRAIRTEWFPQASTTTLASGVIALGIGNGAPLVLCRAEIWEVAILCGHLLVMLALLALWRALKSPGGAVGWLGLASLLLGLALGSRPSLLPASLILLLPLARADAAGRRSRLLAAAVIPIAAVGAGLLVYNHLRFGSPLEFGQRYQLAGDRQDRAHFGLSHLAFNLRAYLPAPAGWGEGFPWVRWAGFPDAPAGHGNIDPVFGVITNLPFNWLLAALPLAIRGPDSTGLPHRIFLGAPIILAVSGTLLLGSFYGTCTRYQMEFAPWIVMTAAVAALALDARFARQLRLRSIARIAMVIAAAASATFCLLAATKLRALLLTQEAGAHDAAGSLGRSAGLLRQAVRLDRSTAEPHENLALILSRLGADEREVTDHFREALRIEPGRFSAHNNLGLFLAARPGGQEEAIKHIREALRLRPDHPVLHFNLGLQLQEVPSARAEAMRHFRAALNLDPGFRLAREALTRLEAPAPPSR